MKMSALIERHIQGPEGMASVWRIAYPMIISTATNTVIIFCDRLFLSRLSKAALAAAMPAGLTSFVFMSFFIGVVSYVTSLAGQYYGAGKKSRASASAWQGIYFGVISYVILIAVIPLGWMLFRAFAPTPEVIKMEIPYFTILMLGSIFMIAANIFSSFFSGIGRTGIVMRANIIGMLVNLPLNLMLIFGLPENPYFKFPGLGMPGAAIASVIAAFVAMFLMARVFFSRYYRENYESLSGWKFDFELFKRLLKFGIPSGLELFLGVAAFNLFVIIVGSIGIDEQAAVTVIFSWNLIAFLPLIGIQIATSSLVGQGVGAGKHDSAVKVTWSSVKIGLIYTTILSVFYIFFPEQLIKVFKSGKSDEFVRVIRMAKPLLMLGAGSMIANVFAVVMSGSLKGAGDTRFIMITSTALHWMLLVIPVTLMVYVFKTSLIIIWIWFIFFSVCLAALYWFRFKTGKWREISVIEETSPRPLHAIGEEFPPE